MENRFSIGYSPERINPGDKEHTLTRITKVVAEIRRRRWNVSRKCTPA